VVTLAMIGMLASFARAEPAAARALHARPPGRLGRLLWAPLPPVPIAIRRGRNRPARDLNEGDPDDPDPDDRDPDDPDPADRHRYDRARSGLDQDAARHRR
jgi:cell division protein FtsW